MDSFYKLAKLTKTKYGTQPKADSRSSGRGHACENLFQLKFSI